MKLMLSFPRPVNPLILLLFLLCISLSSKACGPYDPLIPTPDFFALSTQVRPMSAYERDDNLRLWQALTSPRIPLEDIEQAVYKHSYWEFYERTGWQQEITSNLFYAYLNNTNDYEITNFLGIAKRIEERWHDMQSPWYYPASRGDGDVPGEFEDLIEECKSSTDERLRDRYALQIVRALFASRKYAECALYADSAFASFPDDNLMKRMARRYAAGCWKRLGEPGRADTIFALAGDALSVSDSCRMVLMASLNPDAPQFFDYIRYNADDSTFMLSVAPIAASLLKNNKVANRGDWNFLLAHINNEFLKKPAVAHKHIITALGQKFSSDELHDLARVYKMKLDAITGNSGSLLGDLKWIEGKYDVLAQDANEWIRRLQNVVYVDWVPRLWKKGDYATAILLCSYADNIEPKCKKHFIWDNGNEPTTLNKSAMRQSERYRNELDYTSLSFQLMGSLTSSQLASVFNAMMSGGTLYSYLRQNVRTDGDYYNELIGTLALREENYARAVKYLSRVGEHYLRTTNIYKEGYLRRDPRAKLQFARRMRDLKHAKDYGRSADERGIARLRYAIERYASFEDKWALTQYWRGWVGLFNPSLQYWDDNFAETNYSFLYDYDNSGGPDKSEALYKKEVAAALEMLVTDEGKARAQYILGNVRTVIKKYPDTAAAAEVRASCDGWRMWL